MAIPSAEIPASVPGQGFSIGTFENGSGSYCFESGGVLYAALLSQTDPNSGPAGDNKVHLMSSADSGATWTELDAANAPDTKAHGLSSTYGTAYCAAIDGTTIWVLWVIQYGVPTPVIHGIAAAPFNTLSGTWGATTEYATPLPGVTGLRSSHNGIELTIEMAVRAAGDYIVVYSGPNETVSGHVWGRVYYAQFDGATWGAAIELPGQTGNDYYFMAQAVAVESMRTHILYEGFTGTGPSSDSSTLYHIAIDTDGVTFGSAATLATDFDSASGGRVKTGSNAVIFAVSSVPYLGFAALADVSSGPNINATVFFYAPLDSTPLSPVFANSTIASGDWTTDPNLPSSNSLDQGILLALAYSLGTLAVAWPFVLDHAGAGAVYSFVTAPAALPLAWTARIDVPLVSGGGETWNPNQVGLGPTANGFGLLGMNVGDVVSPGQAISQFSAISISSTLQVFCNNPPAGVWGSPYSHDFTASGGTP